ncbi:manganese-binding transcriptional regulator MntR [Alphaproteobacteria bacterium]|nr:manganese-binding transcriptional regulator MntR [Alphaproteobacteria bacterium]
MTKRGNLADASKQAKWFEKLREAHQNETAEDYVELISDLIEAKGEARVTDLSQRFGVSHPTVNKVITRLKKEKLVIAEPYRSIFLTPKGRTLAEKCKERHIIVVDFLRALGISEKIAEMDAEGIEHHVSEETLEAFQKFTKSS